MTKNVLVVTNTKAFFASNIRDALDKIGYTAILKNPQTSELSAIKEVYGSAIIMLDEELIKNDEKNVIPALMYLKDKLIEDDLPVYIIGYPEDISIVEQTVPSTIILERFIRPINLAEAIDQFDISMRENITEGKKKILVVDDSGPMLRKVKTWFEAKYRVFVANSGTAAIKALTTNKPDLILLDYEMPVVDGKQVLEMIRSEEEFAEIPVIFLTGKSDRATVESVLKLKPEGYLLKTMPPMEIEKAVDDFFLKRRAIK